VDLVDLTPGERQAIQRSLQWLGTWDGAVDGELSGALVESVRQFQRSRGEQDTGLLSPGEMLALHRQAALQRPPEPLPQIDLTEAVSRSAIGDPEGQRLMAMILDPAFIWQGLPKNRARAIQFYELAARQGDAPAATRLGLILAAPGRPAADQAAARPWLEQAARAGEPLAALRLAELLLEGPEAQAGRGRAIELLSVAAASPESGGIAAARLRDLGQPVAR
jgi:TPR repeat protein